MIQFNPVITVLLISIILILCIINYLFIIKLKNSFIVPVLNCYDDPELDNDVINFILKVRRELNESIKVPTKSSLYYLIPKRLYQTQKVTIFLSNLKTIGYELNTEIYSGTHYQLQISWKYRNVQETE